MAKVKVFDSIETLALGPPFIRGAIAEHHRSVTIVPHFDEVVVRVGEEEYNIPLGNAERILGELARGNSVEITVVVALPGSEETLEIKTTWVGSKLAGGSKASTIKLLEETTYKLVGVPTFRGLLGRDQATLVERLHHFLSFEGEELIIAQVCELSGREGSEWRVKNWYTSGLAT